MNSLTHILFPVDFSAECRAAAPFVRAAAVRWGSDVCLFHVVDIPATWCAPPEVGVFVTPVDFSRLLQDRRATLKVFLKDELADIAVKHCVQSGDTGTMIIEYARRLPADVIMLPTHGYGPVRSLLLGSIAAKVLHDAECPVWTVAHANDMQVTADRPWRHILCPVAAELRDAPLIHWAVKFAETHGATLKLVHAVSGFEPERRPGEEEDPLRDFFFDTAREQIGKLQAEAGTNLEVLLEAGRVSEVVRDLAIREGAELIIAGRAMLHKPLGRLRSNAYAIVRDAPCPVISV